MTPNTSRPSNTDPCLALSQADAIVRSARGEIDWTREPLTETERRVRARWIGRYLDDGDPISAGSLLCRVTAIDLRARATDRGFRLPDDLRNARARAVAIEEAADAEDAEEERLALLAEIESEDLDA